MIENLKRDLAVFFGGVGLLFVWYSKVMLHLNTTYFSSSGDGLKNYYTTIYQVLHGKSFWHFEGMNYPFGENLVFTDAQPLLVWFLQVLGKVFPATDNYLLGILNACMLFSIPLGAVFLQRILAHYKVEFKVSLFASLAIAFFSPQINRLIGHYALGYVFVIPLFYYLLVKFLDRKSIVLSGVITVLIVCMAFVHLYYLLIVTFFITTVYLVKAIYTKEYKFWGVHWFIQVVLSFVLTMVILKLVDGVADRPNSPYGFLSYRALWEGLLISMDSSIIVWIEENVVGIRHVGFEARAYLGMLSVSLFFYYLIKWFKNKFKHVPLPFPDNQVLLGVLLLTVFALGVPFIYGLEFLIKYLGPLQQFRAIARFVWPLYFVVNISAIVVLYRKREEILSNKVALISVSIILLVFMVEIHIKNSKVSHQISNIRIDEKDVLDQFLLDKGDKFQALLPLPFYHEGSEFLTNNSTDRLTKKTLQASILTGMPVFSNKASRTSFKQTMAYFNYFYSNRVDETLKTSSKRPYLLIVDKNRTWFRLAEQKVIAKATLLFETEEFLVKSLAELEVGNVILSEVLVNSILNDVVLEDEQKVELNIPKIKAPFLVTFKVSIPENQGGFANYRLYLYIGDKKEKIKIEGIEDLTAIDETTFTYKKYVESSLTIEKVEFEAQTIGDGEKVELQGLSIQEVQ